MKQHWFHSIGAGVAALALLAGCGASDEAQGAADGEEKTEVIVFAAASLTESLGEIADAYEQAHTDIDLVFNFDSSGTLKTQIEEGAPCDLFLSAGQKQMDGLGEQIDSDTRVDLLQNTVVMVTPKDAPAYTFDTITDAQRVALGGADVPVGQYARQILEHLSVWQQLEDAGKLTFGSNVKEVTAQVAAGAVDCGIVYRTDAASEPEIVVTDEAPADAYSPAVYPAAVTANANQAQAAQEFLTYLQTDDAMGSFEAVGFARP